MTKSFRLHVGAIEPSQFFSDELFARVRKKYSVLNPDLFKLFTGHAMLRGHDEISKDGSFVISQLSSAESSSLRDITADLVERVLAGSCSLTRILAHFAVTWDALAPPQFYCLIPVEFSRLYKPQLGRDFLTLEITVDTDELKCLEYRENYDNLRSLIIEDVNWLDSTLFLTLILHRSFKLSL